MSVTAESLRYFSRRDARLLGLPEAVFLGALRHPSLQSVRLGELYSFTLDPPLQKTLLPFWDAAALEAIATRLRERKRLARSKLLPWEGVLEVALPPQPSLAAGDRAAFSSAVAQTLGLEAAVLLHALESLQEQRQGLPLRLGERERKRLLPFWTWQQCAKTARFLLACEVLGRLEEEESGLEVRLRDAVGDAAPGVTESAEDSFVMDAPLGVARPSAAHPSTAHAPVAHAPVAHAPTAHPSPAHPPARKRPGAPTDAYPSTGGASASGVLPPSVDTCPSGNIRPPRNTCPPGNTSPSGINTYPPNNTWPPGNSSPPSIDTSPSNNAWLPGNSCRPSIYTRPPTPTPSPELYKSLKQLGIPRAFARGRLEEFLRYRREQQLQPEFLPSAFLRWMRRAWEYHCQEEAERIPLAEDWQPCERSREILAREAIPADFIAQQLEEFRLGAGGRRAPSGVWERRFLSYIRKRWQNHGEKAARPGFSDRIRDTSWARESL